MERDHENPWHAKARDPSGLRDIHQSLFEAERDWLEEAQKTHAQDGSLWEDSACPLCKDDEALPHLKVDMMTYVACCTCGLVYQRPRLAPWAHQAVNRLDPPRWRAEWEAHHQEMATSFQRESFEAMEPYLRSRVLAGRCLDLGCGTGYLAALLEQAGYTVEGLEAEPNAAEVARRNISGRVRCGMVEQEQYPPSTFDAIIMHESLYHFYDPLAVVQRAHTWLKPEGLLVVFTMNIEGLTLRRVPRLGLGVYSLSIPVLFGRQTLETMLDRGGFRVIATKGLGLMATPHLCLWPRSRGAPTSLHRGRVLKDADGRQQNVARRALAAMASRSLLPLYSLWTRLGRLLVQSRQVLCVATKEVAPLAAGPADSPPGGSAS
ncbi:class I SAM-dependent methyltransferase [Nitrospinae bacterium AH_259_B05_G02_I21]|nr:class I SAM-dependent methyltransferase [Nitrospinae bacterium AH_259_B05_G02_I21]